MATLEKLRKRAGIIIAIVIGLALLAFVLGDIMKGNNPSLTRRQMVIAEIDGKSVSIEQFDNYITELENIYKFRFGDVLDEQTIESIYEQAWYMLIHSNMMEKEFEKLGLTVSSHEVWDIAQGSNPHPIVRDLFTDRETGQFNRVAFSQFITNLDENPNPEEKMYWIFLESEILRERIMTKYNNLVSKGLYVTSLEAKDEYYKTNKRASFNYIYKPYTVLTDSSITVSKKELEAYYELHKNEYKQEPSRDIEYVIFNIVPSEQDNREIQEWIENERREFVKVDTGEVIDYVNLESDTRYIDRNYAFGQLSPVINDFMFEAEIGEVYGPYFEDQSYKLAKLISIVYLPDSVRARHILLSPEQFTKYEELTAMTDSIKNMLGNGANFEVLAALYSADKSNSETGGDLGWFPDGQMVKPFNDVCFEGEIGEIQTVNTQFGTHIVEVLNKSENVKKVNVAILDRRVDYSNRTHQKIYAQAHQFAGENNTYDKFDKAIKEKGYNRRVATNIVPNGKNMPGIETPRPIIRWAYEAEKYEISDVFDFNDMFVIATVTQIKEKGHAPLEDIKTQIEVEVRKQKLGESLSQEINEAKTGVSSIEALAEKLGTQVKLANNISFASFSLPEAGIEPKIIATAVTLEKGELSDPIIGDNGVFVVEIIDNSVTDKQEFRYEQMRLSNTYQMRARSELYEALIESADIDDKRVKFY